MIELPLLDQFPETIYVTHEEYDDNGYLSTHSTAEDAVGLGETRVIAAYQRQHLFSGTLVTQLITKEIA